MRPCVGVPPARGGLGRLRLLRPATLPMSPVCRRSLQFRRDRWSLVFSSSSALHVSPVPLGKAVAQRDIGATPDASPPPPPCRHPSSGDRDSFSDWKFMTVCGVFAAGLAEGRRGPGRETLGHGPGRARSCSQHQPERPAGGQLRSGRPS